MIAKHIPMTKAKKSSFAGLVSYLSGEQNKEKRVGVIRISNCQSDELGAAVLEVLNTQAQNTRAEADKTYHLLVSFRAGEQPDTATLRSIEDRLCEGLGFVGHQRVSVLHHDTDNLHLHIAINKIHPTRYTIHEPFRAYRTLARLCEKLETAYQLQKDTHEARKTAAENRANDMERHADLESLIGFVQRRCRAQLREARTWEELHAVLGEHGLQLYPRANGLVITADNGTSIKASSVGREFSKAKLEQRFGPYQPVRTGTPDGDQASAANEARRYEKRPLASRVDTTELYARYIAAQAALAQARAVEWERARTRKERMIAAAKGLSRLKRAAIRLAKLPGPAKKVMYGVTSAALHAEIAQIHKQYQKQRQEIYERHRRRQWADWLRDQANAGDAEALAALRGRGLPGGLSGGFAGNTVTGVSGARQPWLHVRHDSVTKKGTVIYRIGASAVRDDGNKLQVSIGAERAALEAALRMAVARYGGRLAVSGSDAFREQVVQAAATGSLDVTFDDAALERRRQQLAQSLTTKESKHEHSRHVRRGADCRGHEPTGRPASSGGNNRRGGSAGPEAARDAVGTKSHARRAWRPPPPIAADAMRGMSERGLVHHPEGREVLLPRHVHHGVQQQGTEPDHGVRRHLDRAGRVAGPTAARPKVGKTGHAPPPASKGRLAQLSEVRSLGQVAALNDRPAPRAVPSGAPDAAATAAERYVSEREQKRSIGFDIPKHVGYTALNAGAAEYAGTRHMEGQVLALLKRGDEVMVLEIDDATAKRLKRLPLGAQVGVSAQGVIRKKGRSR